MAAWPEIFRLLNEMIDSQTMAKENTHRQIITTNLVACIIHYDPNTNFYLSLFL